jgi:hypothetical protein
LHRKNKSSLPFFTYKIFIFTVFEDNIRIIALSQVKQYYYIRLYFTVFLLARSNTPDIPFSKGQGNDSDIVLKNSKYEYFVCEKW